MSDIRFIILGLILVFAGFLLTGIVGSQFSRFTIQANEFGNCFDYAKDGKAIAVDCNMIIQNKYIFFAVVLSLIGSGIISLIKGVRGKWDQDVKSDEMVGPKSGP